MACKPETALVAQDREMVVVAGHGERPGAVELAALVAGRLYMTTRLVDMETAGRAAF